MYSVYILRSNKIDGYYVGLTHDLEQRLKRHNRGLVRSTKKGVPWKIIYNENYQTKSEAYKREMQIKSYKGGEAFKKLVSI